MRQAFPYLDKLICGTLFDMAFNATTSAKIAYPLRGAPVEGSKIPIRTSSPIIMSAAEDNAVSKRDRLKNCIKILLADIRRRIWLHAHPSLITRFMEATKRCDSILQGRSTRFYLFAKPLIKRNEGYPVLIGFRCFRQH